MAESSESVTEWLRLLEHGNEAAAAAIWTRYSQQLVNLAKNRLKALKDPLADEEDLAICVFASIVQGMQQGRVLRIENRQHLWSVLAWATRRRAADMLRRENAAKRSRSSHNANEVTARYRQASPGGSVYMSLFRASEQEQSFVDQRLAPELEVDFLDELQYLKSRLPNESLRELARLRIEGWQNQDIAIRMRTSLSSIERKLRLIREIWLRELSK